MLVRKNTKVRLIENEFGRDELNLDEDEQVIARILFKEGTRALTTVASLQTPVHMFRQSLWAEHMCVTDPVFRFPGTIDCVAKMKEMLYHNWLAYIDTQQRPTPGQCLPYPLNIMPDGTIENLDGIKEFPDFPPGSKIMGKKSAVIPQKVTT